MRIGVIADTHIPRTADWIPRKLCDELKGVDLILHAGDLTELSVVEKLKEYAPVKAVYGNMDDAFVQETLPRKEVIEAGKFKIGLIHGLGPPFGILDRVRKEFGNVDVIVFGHSHSTKNEVKNGVLFFNPGSPTDKIFARYTTYGIIDVNDKIRGEIIKL